MKNRVAKQTLKTMCMKAHKKSIKMLKKRLKNK